MISFIPDLPSSRSTILAISLEFLMIFWVLSARKEPHILQPQKQIMALVFCLLHYMLYMVGGDYFSYKEMVEEAGLTNLMYYSVSEFHLEIAYVSIINFVNNNYLLFRLVVWGGAMSFFILTSLYLKLDRSTFIFYLCIYIAPLTATSRVGLAYAVAFLGFAFIVRPFQYFKIGGYAIGTALVFGSLWLHRSAPFLLAVFPLAMLKFSKRTIYALLVAIPIIVFLMKSGFVDYIFSMETTAEDSLFDAQTAQGYLSSEKKFSSKGPGELLRLILEYLSFALILMFFIKMIRERTYHALPPYIQKFINASILIIVFSVVILIMPGANTYKTFERLIAFSIVPIAMVLSYLMRNGKEKKMVDMVTLAILGWVGYDALYTFYLEV